MQSSHCLLGLVFVRFDITHGSDLQTVFFVGFDITNPWIQDHFPEHNSHINFLATIDSSLRLIQGLPLQHEDLMPSVSKFSTPCYILRKGRIRNIYSNRRQKFQVMPSCCLLMFLDYLLVNISR